jgi:hypothetical protein
VLKEQGAITTAGYQQQAAAYTLEQQASGVAQQADIAAATGEQQAAQEYAQEASLFNQSSTGDFISAVVSGIAGIIGMGTVFLPSGGATSGLLQTIGGAETSLGDGSGIY